MKRLVFMVTAALVLPSPVWAQDAPKPWEVCLPDHAIAPYISAPGKAPGVSERLITDAAARAHLAVVFVRMPSARCLAMLRMGMADAGLVNSAEEHPQPLRFPLQDGKLDTAKRVMALASPATDYFLVAKPTLNPEEQAKLEAWWAAIAALRDMPAYKPR